MYVSTSSSSRDNLLRAILFCFPIFSVRQSQFL